RSRAPSGKGGARLEPPPRRLHDGALAEPGIAVDVEHAGSAPREERSDPREDLVELSGAADELSRALARLLAASGVLEDEILDEGVHEPACTISRSRGIATSLGPPPFPRLRGEVGPPRGVPLRALPLFPARSLRRLPRPDRGGPRRRRLRA